MLYTKRTFDFEYPLEEADIALLGIPFDSTQTGKQTKYAPLFIREAVRNLVGYDPELKINIFRKYKFCDLGDLEIVYGNWKLTEKRIEDTIKEIFELNKKIFPVFLGGEHLITLGILNSLSKIFNKITVVQLDAHPDLMPNFLGEKYSHLTWAYHIIKNPNFELIQTGCRVWSEEEDKTFKRIEILSRKLLYQKALKIKNPVYLTIDLDVLDPIYTPEVSTPEPNGLTLEQLFKILKNVCKNKLIGFDLVECACDKVSTKTALIAANIIKKVLGYSTI